MPAAPTAAPGPVPRSAAGRADGSPCPACGTPLRPWIRAPTGEPALPEDVDLLRCPACGSGATAGPPPSFAAVHDGGGYASQRPRGAALARPAHAAFDRQRLRLLGPPAGRLLDVGAGRGRFVAAAARAGWRASGIEPSARGVAAARAAYGVELLRAGVEDAPVGDGALDAATAWHVLEHLQDPADALVRIAGWLRPDGLLLVGVPNRASWQARLGGRRWYHLDLPRHRVHLTPEGLHALLRAAGLEPVATHHLLLEHNPFGMWQSLVNRLTGTTSHLYQLLKRAEAPRPGPLAVTLLLVPALPAAILVEALAGLARRGGTVAVLARRPRGDL